MGLDFPAPIRSYIDANVIDKRCPAYLRVDIEKGLSDWGGALHHYGIEGLQPGQDAAERLPFLMGLLPVAADEQGFVLTWMETSPGCYADVHLLGFEHGTWVVLLDATGEATQHCVMQQKINDISLHLEAAERTLEQSCGLREPSWQGMCIHQNFIIQWVNPAFAGMLGATDPDAWVGRDLRTLIAGEACGRFESEMKQVMQGHIASSDGVWPGQRTDGQRYWMKAQSVEKTWRGQPAMLMMSLDITEQKRLEAQLQQTREIAHLATSADGFLHDLSNVFTIILGCTELALHSTPPDDMMRQNLCQLQTASRQAWDLVQNVLALNQQPSPSLELSCKRLE